jgi:RhoGAP domain/Leucine Rich repeat
MAEAVAPVRRERAAGLRSRNSFTATEAAAIGELAAPRATVEATAVSLLGSDGAQVLANSDLTPGQQKFVRESVLGKYSNEAAQFAGWCEVGTPKDEHVVEIKQLKLSSRIVVVGRYRMFFISKSRTGGKTVDLSPHLFDLETVDELPGSRADTLRLFVRSSQGVMDGAADSGKTKIVVMFSATKTPAILNALAAAYARISHGFSQGTRDHAFKMELKLPNDRYPDSFLNVGDVRGATGLLATYAAMRSLRKEPAGRGFPRFIQDLIEEKAVGVPLHQCPGIEQKSPLALPMGSVLQTLNFTHNFRCISLKACSFEKLSPGLCVRYSTAITKLVLVSIDGTVDWVGLARALRLNQELQLQHLDVSENSLSHKDSTALAQALGSFTHGFHVLRMASCKMKPKQVEEICQYFLEFFGVSLTLRELDLSFNSFGEEGSRSLGTWLTKCGSALELRRLKLRKASVITDLLFPDSKAIGSLPFLEFLDVAGAEWTPETWDRLVHAIHMTKTLAHVIVTSARGVGSTEARKLYDALLGHKLLYRVILEMADLPLSEPDGSMHGGATFAPLEKLSSTVSYRLRKLDVSNCKISAEGLSFLLSVLREHCMTVTDLGLGSNLDFGKNPDACVKFMGSLVQFLEMGSSLLTLRLRGSKGAELRQSLEILFRFLARDQSLEELDVRGNRCADTAFFFFTESLHENRRLQTAWIDKNELTYNSLLGLETAMRSNAHLRDLFLNESKDVAKVRQRFSSSEQGLLTFMNTMAAIQSRLRQNSDTHGPPPTEFEEARLEGDRWKSWADNDEFAPPSIACPLAQVPGHIKVSHMAAGATAPLRTGATFGQPLSSLPPTFSLVRDCIAYIDARALTIEGIFRLSGSVTQIKTLKQRLDAGQPVDLNEIRDPHVVCGLLKLWLRELPEPLFPTDLTDVALLLGELKDLAAATKMLQAIVQSIQEPQQSLMRQLLQFQLRIVGNSELNRMSAANVSTVFAPNIIRPTTDNDLLRDTPRINALWVRILNMGESVFTGPHPYRALGSAVAASGPGELPLGPGDFVFLEKAPAMGQLAGTGMAGTVTETNVQIVRSFAPLGAQTAAAGAGAGAGAAAPQPKSQQPGGFAAAAPSSAQGGFAASARPRGKRPASGNFMGTYRQARQQEPPAASFPAAVAPVTAPGNAAGSTPQAALQAPVQAPLQEAPQPVAQPPKQPTAKPPGRPLPKPKAKFAPRPKAKAKARPKAPRKPTLLAEQMGLAPDEDDGNAFTLDDVQMM